MTRTTNLTKLVLVALVGTAARAIAGDSIPAEFRGDWVPASGTCAAKSRLRVGERTVTLVDGKHRQDFVDVDMTSYRGRYTGMAVVASPTIEVPEVGGTRFDIVFNADDKQGVTKVWIYQELVGPTEPPRSDHCYLEDLEAIYKTLDDAKKKVAARFPALNLKPLKKCP